MSYQVTRRSLAGDSSTLVISVKSQNTTIPFIIYNFLNVMQGLGLSLSLYVLLSNRDKFSSDFTLNDGALFDLDSLLSILALVAIATVCQAVVGSKIISEDLMLVSELGVQLESHTLSGKASRRFIDIERVRDIVINEVSRSAALQLVLDPLGHQLVHGDNRGERERTHHTVRGKLST